MYSQEELNISNKSYINKDFPVVYTELLDLAQKISYKYDPTTSNESDPMIVLLKLMAILGDKLNYNVDKNILERFLTSITQWNSMQERTSSLGYNMHYYKSSTGYISIKYNGEIPDNISDMGTSGSIHFPAFSTKFSNSNTNLNYVLLKDVDFYKSNIENNTYISAPIIQGECKTFTTLTGDETLVTLTNLDDFNRLYFPEAMVAQNGVFIEQENSVEKWEQVDNLNVQVPNKKCFIFRYDSAKKLPYIQFPDDIANLIAGGLTIRYIITNGENGNTGAASIDTLLTNGQINNFTYEEDVLTNLDNYYVTNNSAFNNGENIEDIDSAYFNFQKTVGTFDTLVACRDYANYIYNLTDENFKSLVSNIQVCDRRDDYNYSTKVMTFNEYGQSLINNIKQQSDGHGGTEDAVTAFDLMLYPLQPMVSNTDKDYRSSFKVLSNLSAIIPELQNNKCISHNYKDLSDTDVYAFKNYYKLNAKITTTYKVNSLEQTAIKDNIIQALIDNFNARKVDYGTEIPYDTILKVIENADSRIKFVSLNEPELDAKLLLADNSEIDFGDYPNYKLNYLAKNVLAGRVSLYNYDENIKYDFGQTSFDNTSEISSISTCAKIQLSNSNYEIQDNEAIQIFQQNFINGREWNYGWFYRIFDTSENPVSWINGLNKVTANHYIRIYEDKDSAVGDYSVELNSGYVELNFEPKSGQPAGAQNWQVNSGDSIIEKTPNIITLDEPLYVYWLTNNIKLCQKLNENYIPTSEESEEAVECSYIPWDSNNTYILLENEYLYITDKYYTYLNAYGPGTRLVATGVNEMVNKYLPIIDFNQVDLNNLKDRFIAIDFNANISSNIKHLDLYEQQILSLAKGDTLKIVDAGETLDLYSSNNNINLQLPYTLRYTLTDGSSGNILSKVAGTYDTYIRARLDLNCSNTNSQKLLTNQIIRYNSTNIESPKEITSKFPISVIGGQDRLISNYSFEINKYLKNVLYIYEYENISADDISKVALQQSNYYRIAVNNSNGTHIDEVTMYPTVKSSQDTLVMIYVEPLNEDNVYITLQHGGYSMSYPEYDTSNPANPVEIPVTTLHKGMNVLRFNTTTSSSSNAQFTITFKKTVDSEDKLFEGIVIISKPRILKNVYDNMNSINSTLGVTDTSILDIINIYRNNFYYSLYVDKAYEIEDNLNTYDSLFNSNNIANKITIPEIDIDYAIANINIAKSSQL